MSKIVVAAWISCLLCLASSPPVFAQAKPAASADHRPGISMTVDQAAHQIQPADWSMPTDPAFGAKCDGISDDTDALQAWASSVQTGANLRLPNSACLFTRPIHFAQANAVTVEGAGRQSQLLYAGNAKQDALVTIGTSGAPGGCSVKSWRIEAIKIASRTVMSQGDGLLLSETCETEISQIAVGGDLDGNTNLFNAIRFAGGNTIHLRGYSFAASHAAEIVHGSPAHQLTDLFQTQGKISHSAIGLLIAGGVGGNTIDQTDILLNGINVQIDQSYVRTGNRQIFFGPGVAIDATNGGGGIGLYLLDPGFHYNQSQIYFTGTWIASAQPGTVEGGGKCVYIAPSARNWTVTFNAGTIYGCNGDGIRSDSPTARISVSATRIGDNAQFGFNQTVANPNVVLADVNWVPANGRGNVSPALAGVVDGPPRQALSLAGVPYAQLPACNASTQGTLAFVIDASGPITRWHQEIRAGGGAQRTYVQCANSAWLSF